jgi:hypothetical protein
MRKITTVELVLGTVLGLAVGFGGLRFLLEAPVTFTRTPVREFLSKSRGKHSKKESAAPDSAAPASKDEFWKDGSTFGGPVEAGPGKTITTYGSSYRRPREIRVWIPGVLAGLILFFALRARGRRRRILAGDAALSMAGPLPASALPIRSRPPGMFMGATCGWRSRRRGADV